jgi:TonB-linked SusC/RagA family outer membrane protein
VVLRGTRTGTQTDARGEFSLRVPDLNGTLTISRMGFARQEVQIAGRTTVDVSLVKTAISLTEVVVVGYGTQKRSDITGSVASVGQDKLQEKPNVSLAQALEGSVPGVNVTTGGAGAEPSVSILVRGRNSISASTTPLLVVDGIPYNGTLSELNPNDIQSMEILKDASATAIYGTRGSNGVILITSRRGQEGNTRLTYSGYAGTQNIENVPALMNAQQFYDFKCVRARTSAAQTCDQILTPTELVNYKAGVNTDWLSLGTRTGSTVNNDVNFSGGSGGTRYMIGGSLMDVNGVAVNDAFHRATVRVNFDQKVRNWLSIGTSTQGARTNRDGVPVNFTTAFQSNPLITPYDSLGNQIRLPWPEDPSISNALENLNAVDEDQSRRVFSSNYFEVAFPKIDGLTYRLNAGIDIADRDADTYYGRNTQTGFTLNGRGTTTTSRRNDWTLENVVRLARTMGKHSFDLTGLYSEQSSSLEGDTTRAQGYPNDVLGARSNLPLLIVPNIGVVESKLLSQMGRLNYSYDERYLATLTARRDGYSGFGENNKYGVFPTMALGWNVSNESFFPWKRSVDALKVRLSYGKTGNQAIRPYQTFAQLDDRSYLIGDATAPGYYPTALGNPDLKWETTLSKNLGIDLSMWKERVQLTVDAYDAQTSDLLLRRAISSVHGITSVLQNIGKTGNKGFEFALNTVNIDRTAFQWSSNLNMSVNRNRIVDLYGDQTDDIANGWFIGQPIDVNYGYKFIGTWQVADSTSGAIAASPQPTAHPGWVKIQDTNGDGKIDASDRTILGSLQPSYSAGLTNTVKIRRVTLSAFFNTVQGVTRANDLLSTSQTFTDVRRNMVYRTWWTPSTPVNDYPSNSNSSNPQGVAFYEDASFIRLKDASISYDLPEKFAAQFNGQSARIYLNGRNLWTKTNWTGLDPELDNQRAVPLEKTITAGLTVRF